MREYIVLQKPYHLTLAFWLTEMYRGTGYELVAIYGDLFIFKNVPE